jgi:hypothetical protein
MNKTCLANSTLQYYGEWNDCYNGTCVSNNHTQLVPCPYGCDATDYRCNDAPYVTDIEIAVAIIIVIAFFVWLIRR